MSKTRKLSGLVSDSGPLADGLLSAADIGALSLAGGILTGTITFAGAQTFPGTQAALVSGTNIKTVNGNSVLGSGNIQITSGVTSVAGKTGVVTLAKGDVGLGNVDNTSDANKPISTAQQTALNLKAPKDSPTFTGLVNLQSDFFGETATVGGDGFLTAGFLYDSSIPATALKWDANWVKERSILKFLAVNDELTFTTSFNGIPGTVGPVTISEIISEPSVDNPFMTSYEIRFYDSSTLPTDPLVFITSITVPYPAPILSSRELRIPDALNVGGELRVNGAIGLNGANYGTAGQVPVSQGPDSPTVWGNAGDVTLTGTQTLTNKTLTSPVINGVTGDTSVINFGSGQFYKDASGNVGIGTSSPNKRFSVGGASTQFTVELTAGANDLIKFDTYNASAVKGIYTWSQQGTEVMRLNSSGNVGIGTSSPTQKLHVTSSGTSDGVIQLGGTASNGYFSQINQNANNLQLIANGDQAYRVSLGTNNGTGNITFQTAGGATGNTERMRIDSSGNVGIGTSSPAARLDVRGGDAVLGTSRFTIGAIELGELGTGDRPTFVDFHGAGLPGTLDFSARIIRQAGSNGDLGIFNTGTGAVTFAANGSERARISSTGGFSVGTTANPGTGAIFATGNITAYYSDDRLKTRLGNIENALDKIKTLDSFYYEANETAQALGYTPVREVGISAQQVQAIMPEVVSPAPIDDKYLTVRYERLVPLLLASIRELEARLAKLEAPI
jgi:hypothetical protein